MAGVDPGVDHRDADRRQERELRPEIEGAVRRQVPLLARERIVGLEGGAATSEPLDVGRAGELAEPRSDRPLDDDGGERCKALAPRAEGALKRRDRRRCGDADREPRGGRGCRQRNGDRKPGERSGYEPAPAHPSRSRGLNPSAKPRAGATLTR